MRNGKNLGWGGDRAQKENKEQIKNQHGSQKYGGKFQKNELKLLYVVALGKEMKRRIFFIIAFINYRTTLHCTYTCVYPESNPLPTNLAFFKL